MLTVTEQAATQIRNITDQQGLPDTGGLRIADDPAGGLGLSLAPVPAEDDLVVNAAGATLFLDARAASALEDKTLDATLDADGRIQFGILDQSAGPA